MSTPALKRLTVAEYLARERVATVRSEFYDGEVFLMSGGTEQHSLSNANLVSELRIALKHRPCRVYDSDMKVKTATGLYTYPDASVVCERPEFEDDSREV